jgi:hypothetical protein
MSATDRPQPLLRFAGRRPEEGARASAPFPLAVALRDYAIAQGLAIDKLTRSRVAASDSIHLAMTDLAGRCWNMRVSNHRRPRRTGHAVPHVDLVSLDGVAGIAVGRRLIDEILAGNVPWFDPDETIRPLPRTRRNSRIRRR